MGSLLPGSHRASCLSLVRENPVVAMRLCSPSQATRLFLAPVWPAASWTGFSCRTSHTRSFLSLDVVAKSLPLALHDRLCTMSGCFSVMAVCPDEMSHSLSVRSPEAEARMFSAAGLKRTCPTFLLTGQWPAHSTQFPLPPRRLCAPGMARQLGHWRYIFDLFCVGVECKSGRYLPHKDSSIVGRRRDDPIVEGVPVAGLESKPRH